MWNTWLAQDALAFTSFDPLYDFYSNNLTIYISFV